MHEVGEIQFLTLDACRYVMPGLEEYLDENNSGSGKGGKKEGKKGKKDEQFVLRDGGDLYALAVVGECGKDLRGGFADGTTFRTYWSRAMNPMALNTTNSTTVKNSAPCSATFTRGEGMWWSEKEELVYFISTNGGAVREGQVWHYNPKTEILTMFYESRNSLDVDAPDNIAIAENGNIILVSHAITNVTEMCLNFV